MLLSGLQTVFLLEQNSFFVFYAARDMSVPVGIVFSVCFKGLFAWQPEGMIGAEIGIADGVWIGFAIVTPVAQGCGFGLIASGIGFFDGA